MEVVRPTLRQLVSLLCRLGWVKVVQADGAHVVRGEGEDLFAAADDR